MTGATPPPRGQVVLRALALEGIAAPRAEAWLPLLSAEERARADRFRFPHDRLSYVAAHALLRGLLADHGVPAPRFALGPWGKPELAEPAGGLRFSLTHTRTLVAAAVACTDDLGVDAEAIDDRLDPLPLADRFFAAIEASMLRAVPEAGQALAFCRVWTLKEAFLKALGSGLSQPLDSFAFGPGAQLSACEAALGTPEGWSFHTRITGPRGALSIALRRPHDLGIALDDAPVGPDALDRRAAAFVSGLTPCHTRLAPAGRASDGTDMSVRTRTLPVTPHG